jgi:hypothetical protein
VGALQITELYQLMSQEARVAIGDYEMALPLLDIDTGSKFGRPTASRINGDAGFYDGAVL